VIEVESHHQSIATHPSRSQASLDSGVASADDNYIEYSI
jgi:hypothetical protein